MATPAVFLRAVLLLGSAMKICHGQCLEGYHAQGNMCFNTSNCQSQSCPQGYHCFSTLRGRHCGYCKTGYRYNGNTSQCEDACQPQPCQNGGRCYAWVNNFWCDCRPGFVGQTCVTKLNSCRSWPCRNGGRCTELDNDFQCNCKTGFTGKTCDIDINIDDCQPQPCQNGGSCTDQVNDFRCACRSGFTGKTCDTDIDDCWPWPCRNGGSCTDQVNDFRCDCRSGFTGRTCDADINECVSSPCQHGTCYNTAGSFRCNCRAGYSGTLCNTETPDLYINSIVPSNAKGKRLKAMFSSEELYAQPDLTWICTVEATDCSTVNVTVSLNITNDTNDTLSYFSLPDGESLGQYGDAFRQATYTTPFRVELHRVRRSTLRFAYITVRANSSLTMVCGRNASASTPTDACTDAMGRQSDSTAAIPAIAGGVAALVVIAVIVVVVIVIFKRKSMADGKKARGDNSVSFNDLRQRENQQESRPTAAAQRSLTSGSATHQGAGVVYAVVNMPTRGNIGVAPPAYAAVSNATGASNRTPTIRASNDQAYSLASNDDPPSYELVMAFGPDLRAAAASLNAAQGTPQTAEDPTNYDVLGQTRRSTNVGRDVTYVNSASPCSPGSRPAIIGGPDVWPTLY